MKKVIFVAALIVLAVAASRFWPKFNNTQVGAGGILGTVTLGPTCPAERVPPEPQCAPKPYQTSVTVYKISGGGRTVYEFLNTAADGSFIANLPPGDYVLLPKGGDNFYPRCAEAAVTVMARRFTNAGLSCDTGIR